MSKKRQGRIVDIQLKGSTEIDAQELKIRHSVHLLFACFQRQQLLLVSPETDEELLVLLMCSFFFSLNAVCERLEIDFQI